MILGMYAVNLYNAKSPLSLVERSIFGRVADLTYAIILRPPASY